MLVVVQKVVIATCVPHSITISISSSSTSSVGYAAADYNVYTELYCMFIRISLTLLLTHVLGLLLLVLKLGYQLPGNVTVKPSSSTKYDLFVNTSLKMFIDLHCHFDSLSSLSF